MVKFYPCLREYTLRILLVGILLATSFTGFGTDLNVANKSNYTVELGSTETYDAASIDGTLYVNGTLIINGTLSIGSNGSLITGSKSVVIVYGNANLGNNVILDVSSFLIIVGNLIKGGSDDKGTLSTSDNTSIYVFGTVEGFGAKLMKCVDGGYDGTTPPSDINSISICDVGGYDDFETNVDPGDLPDGIYYSIVGSCDLSSFDGAAILSTQNPVCSGDEFTLSVDADDDPDVFYSWQSSFNGTSGWTDLSYQFFSSDFSTTPSNTDVYGNASISGGELILTPATNNRRGGFVIQSTLGENRNQMEVQFDYRAYDGDGADGFSLSYAPDIANTSGGGESGEGSGVIVSFDTYYNSNGTRNSQIKIYFGGSLIWSNTVGAYNLRNSSYRNVVITTNDSGELALTIGGTEIVSSLNLPGYTAADKSDWKFKFSARTGGLNDKHSIDNLSIRFDGSSTYATSQTATTYYRAQVWCSGSSVNTSSIEVITTDSPVITTQPSTTGQTECLNGDFTSLSVTATGSSLTYQWYKNTTASTSGGTILSGATAASYKPLASTTGTSYYYCIVTGTCGSATSNVSGAFVVSPLIHTNPISIP